MKQNLQIVGLKLNNLLSFKCGRTMLRHEWAPKKAGNALYCGCLPEEEPIDMGGIIHNQGPPDDPSARLPVHTITKTVSLLKRALFNHIAEIILLLHPNWASDSKYSTSTEQH